MAAPAEVTTRRLDGKWVMSVHSDSPDPILALQGISWILRTAIQMATITLNVRCYTDSQHQTHIDVAQRATAGITSEEKRQIDWVWRTHKDNIFGECRGRSRFCTLEDIVVTPSQADQDGANDQAKDARPSGDPDADTTAWFKDGWLCEGQDGKSEFVQSYVRNEAAGWTANQLWGFATVDGKRYHVRKVIARKGEQLQRVRLVYDYHGPPELAPETKETAGASHDDDDDGLAYGD